MTHTHTKGSKPETLWLLRPDRTSFLVFPGPSKLIPDPYWTFQIQLCPSISCANMQMFSGCILILMGLSESKK